MRLRAEPPRVTRLSRKVLAGLALVASLGLGGALIYALQARHGGNRPRNSIPPTTATTPDGLAGLPKDYSGVPKLGPPLPGDLGRPILQRAERRPGRAHAADGHAQSRPQPGGAAPASGNRVRHGRRTCSRPPRRGRRAIRRLPPRRRRFRRPISPSLGLAPQPSTPSAQDRQLAFLNQAPDKRTVSPDRVAAPASANVLQAGAVIAAALITGIRSDLPGQITAQVTENIYDSPTGQILAHPAGHARHRPV